MKIARILVLVSAVGMVAEGWAQVGTPALVSPTGTSSNTSPTYTWNAVAGATNYYLWINGPAGTLFTQWYTSASVCPGAVCAVKPNLVLAETAYVWWIQAKNGTLVGPWSAATNFRISLMSQPPGAAVLVSPSGSSGSTATYKWNTVATASDYYLWVNNAGGTNVIKQWFTSAAVCSGSTCSVAPAVTLLNGQHTWWIQTRNGAGDGPWSPPMQFIVGGVGGAAPPAPVLTSPSGVISDASPTYGWEKLASATDYYLWIDGPSGNVLKQWYASAALCGASSCAVKPSVALTQGVHNWWVQARNGTTYGPWSQVRQFTVSVGPQPPIAPGLLSPSGTTILTKPTYSWNAVALATDYSLKVNGPSGTVIQQWYTAASTCAGATCSVTPNVTLTFGAYTWWVQGRNGALTGPSSAGLPFTVAQAKPPAATLISPSGSTTLTRPVYSWNAVSSSTDYQLSVDGPTGNLLSQWYSAASICSGATCSITPNVTLAAGSHQWRVLTRNAAGDGPWSAFLSFQLSAALPPGIYVDWTLSANCSGNYSIAARNCTGTNGNAYRTIAAGLAALTSGKTLYLRAGTYVENDSTLPAVGAFSSMTTISAYPGETVTWQNNDIYHDTLSLSGNANNVTVRGINFKGKRYISSNERQWVQWQGNVWRTTDATRPMAEMIEFKSGCNASTIKCSKEVRSYLGQEKTSPANLLSTGSDGDFFQDHTTDKVLYVYSASGNPGQRTDLWETGFGITIGSSSTGTGLVVVEECSFDGQGHAHLKGGYRWKVSKNTFTRVGTDWNDHHIYAWSNLSQGNEAVYEHNYFETDGGTGAALHLYGTGNQVAGEPPDYHVFRYNLVRGTGFWGILLDGSHSSVTNNSFSLEGKGDRAINLQNFDASFNVITNNIFSRPGYAPIVFEGSTSSRPSSNLVEFNLTDAGSLVVGTCSGCTVTDNRTGTSPGWVKAQPTSWIDFRLAAGSAAVDGGLNLGTAHQNGLDPADVVLPPSIVNQNQHGSTWDMGAFVYK